MQSESSNDKTSSSERNVEMVRKYSKINKPSIFKKFRSIFTYFIFIPAIIILCVASYQVGLKKGSHQFSDLVLGETSGINNKTAPQDRDLPQANFAPFWDAWVLLEQNFVDGANGSSTDETTDDQDRVWGAIQGLAQSYGDPFTSFLPPEENESFEADITGEFSGVGMEIGNRDGYLTVISPLPGTPADRSGMRPKDIIEKVDGTDTLRMPVEQAVKLIRGPRGEDVVLTVLRRGEPEALEITITRDVITIPTIETDVVDGVFVIKLFSFTSKSPRLFAEALEEFSQSGSPYLIIDLRGNPGGFLEAAIDITSRFLPEDALIVTEQYSNERGERERYSKGYNHFNDNLRIITLLNGGSASASEIVAGALRDHNKSLVMGQQSFGKGSVQELFNLTKDTSLKITIAKWLTPNGHHISEQGISPDIPTEPYQQDSDNGTYSQDYAQDTEIQKAVEVIKRNDFQDLFESIPEDLLLLMEESKEEE